MATAALQVYDILCRVCLCAGLLNVYMTRLEDGPLDNSEETFRAVSGLLSLLQCFQGDMHPDFQRDMVSFFCGRFTRLHELRSAPLVQSMSMDCWRRLHVCGSGGMRMWRTWQERHLQWRITMITGQLGVA